MDEMKTLVSMLNVPSYCDFFYVNFPMDESPKNQKP